MISAKERLHARTNSELFRTAMRELVSGVSVVCAGQGEERSGVTVTSVVSVCADPPTLLVCINRSSPIYQTLRSGIAFSVNILSISQRATAERFSEGHIGPGAGVDWITLATGAPVLPGALASLDCFIEAMIDHRTHVITVGAVRAVQINGSAKPLAHCNGAYAHILHQHGQAT